MDVLKDYGILSVLILQFFTGPAFSETGSQCDRCRQPGVCRLVSGTNIVTSLGKGYHPVVTIPAGACHINITELARSGNYLALKTTNRPILNAMWNIQHPGNYEGGGASFKYRRAVDDCPGECIVADGPVTSPVIVQVLYINNNPGIQYSYQLPPGVADVTDTGYPGTRRHHVTSQTTSHTSTVMAKKTTPDSMPGTHRRETLPVQNTPVDNVNVTPVSRAGSDSNHFRSKDKSSDENRKSAIRINTNTRHRPIFSSSFTDSRSRVNSGRYNSGSTGNIVGSAQRRRQQLRDVTYYRLYNEDDDVHLGGGAAGMGGVKLTRTSGGPRLPGQTDRGEERPYEWTVTGVTECSRPCDGGVQKTVVACVQTDGRVQVDSTNCDGRPQPAVEHSVCNAAPCHPQWEVGDWFPCSTTCGVGQQTRHVVCRQRISSTQSRSVPEHRCLAGKPVTSRSCPNGPCYRWEMGKWTDCSVDCGLGRRRRRVRCKNSASVVVHGKYCNVTAPPPTDESCDMGSCTQHWFYSAWFGQCSSDCDSGSLSRHVHCATDTGHYLPDDRCDVTTKPANQKRCQKLESACGGKWFIGPWRKCSPSCGNGTRSRDVICVKHVTGGFPAVVPDDQCSTDVRPAHTEPCQTGDCGLQWLMTRWSQCSRSCGGGLKTRAVRCFDHDMEASSLCSPLVKPATTQACNTDRCWTRPDTSARRGCRDKYPNCRVVVQAQLCRYKFYQRKCCASCSNGLG